MSRFAIQIRTRTLNQFRFPLVGCVAGVLQLASVSVSPENISSHRSNMEIVGVNCDLVLNVKMLIDVCKTMLWCL